MKRIFTYLIVSLTIATTSCEDDSDILLGKGSSSSTNNPNSGVTTAKTCSLKEFTQTVNGNEDKFTYSYNSKGQIDKVNSVIGDFVAEYDKNNQISKLVSTEDKRNYIEFVNDSKGNLTETKFILYDTETKKSFTFANKLTLNSSGQVEKYQYNLDFLIAIFAQIFGEPIVVANESIPLTFTYNNKNNLTSIYGMVDGKKELLLENSEFDDKKNPFSGNQTIYRINVFFGLFTLLNGEVNNYNFFNKNNVTKAKVYDNDGKPVDVKYSYTYNPDTYPTVASISITDPTGEIKTKETYSYDCK
ncbi:MAG: hypothetical protein MUF45_00680 [Spirosomaceae bacterium]|nr:hypothetical protein [Spirosomataceae bacterium]